MNKQQYDLITELHKERAYQNNVNHIESYRMDFFLSQIRQLPKGASILDCGARKAHLAKVVNSGTNEIPDFPDFMIVSFDIDNWIGKHVKDNYIVGDCEGHLPFRNESFGSVVFAEIYEHLQTPWRAVHEIWRVLKPYGIFIGSTPNPSFVEYVKEEPEHIRPFITEEDLLRLLALFINTFYIVEGQYWLFLGRKQGGLA